MLISSAAGRALRQPFAVWAALIFLALMVGLCHHHEGQEIVSTQRVRGRVQSVAMHKSYTQRAFDLSISLPDGQTCVLSLREPIPARGSDVPVLQHTLRNQSSRCRFERDTWQQEQREPVKTSAQP